MHASLERNGADLKTFRGVRSREKGKPKYALRAQELADWLVTPFSRLPHPVKKYSGKETFDKIAGQRGVIFFQNYWGPGQQGDHIDLWDGSRLTDWKSWARIHLHVSWQGTWSDYRQAPSVWFWML